MRREQVLKICLNHRLTPDLMLTPKGDSGRSFQWLAADFSEGEVKQEQFAIMFKTVEIAKDFLDAIHTAQLSLSNSDESLNVQASSPGNLSNISAGKLIVSSSLVCVGKFNFL
jgi:E3 SUMO-protein ligase RanBP2